MTLLAFRRVCHLPTCLLLTSHFVPFKCVQFVRELPFVVVPEEEVQAARRRGEKALSKGFGTAGPLQRPTGLLLLTGIFSFFLQSNWQ